jgi:hypothetical protein
MAELTGSEILAKALKKEGTDDLFFLMGGPMLLAESSCIKEGIRPDRRAARAVRGADGPGLQPACCRSRASAWRRAAPA